MIFEICPQLVVQELNYVAQNGPGPRSENHEEPQSDAGTAIIM